jgi:hypothetical protein
MSSEERLNALKELESLCGSQVIAYVTGDRHPTAAQISDEAVRLLYEHLNAIGPQDRINLFLYTRGGELVAPPRIVHLFREYAKAFYVLVPYRAHSAGTSICLGADFIVMGKMAELTPVDPTTANPFNPQAVQGDPRDPMTKIPISVEDVEAYLLLASERAKLVSEQEKIEVFRALTSTVQPMALGNVHRVSRDIRKLTPELLAYQLKQPDEEKKIPQITKTLTETYTHNYRITRDVAQSIGLKILKPDDKLEAAMWRLYELYEKDLHLREVFDPEAVLGTQQSATVVYDVALIESLKRGDAFSLEVSISRPQMPTLTLPSTSSPQPRVPAPQIPIAEEFTVKLKPKGWNRIY